LPRGVRDFNEARIAEIESFFGKGGPFPAVNIEK
jgi:hypothetical protein